MFAAGKNSIKKGNIQYLCYGGLPVKYLDNKVRLRDDAQDLFDDFAEQKKLKDPLTALGTAANTCSDKESALVDAYTNQCGDNESCRVNLGNALKLNRAFLELAERLNHPKLGNKVDPSNSIWRDYLGALHTTQQNGKTPLTNASFDGLVGDANLSRAEFLQAVVDYSLRGTGPIASVSEAYQIGLHPIVALAVKSETNPDKGAAMSRLYRQAIGMLPDSISGDVVIRGSIADQIVESVQSIPANDDAVKPLALAKLTPVLSYKQSTSPSESVAVAPVPVPDDLFNGLTPDGEDLSLDTAHNAVRLYEEAVIVLRRGNDYKSFMSLSALLERAANNDATKTKATAIKAAIAAEVAAAKSKDATALDAVLNAKALQNHKFEILALSETDEGSIGSQLVAKTNASMNAIIDGLQDHAVLKVEMNEVVDALSIREVVLKNIRDIGLPSNVMFGLNLQGDPVLQVQVKRLLTEALGKLDETIRAALIKDEAKEAAFTAAFVQTVKPLIVAPNAHEVLSLTSVTKSEVRASDEYTITLETLDADWQKAIRSLQLASRADANASALSLIQQTQKAAEEAGFPPVTAAKFEAALQSAVAQAVKSEKAISDVKLTPAFAKDGTLTFKIEDVATEQKSDWKFFFQADTSYVPGEEKNFGFDIFAALSRKFKLGASTTLTAKGALLHVGEPPLAVDPLVSAYLPEEGSAKVDRVHNLFLQLEQGIANDTWKLSLSLLFIPTRPAENNPAFDSDLALIAAHWAYVSSIGKGARAEASTAGDSHKFNLGFTYAQVGQWRLDPDAEKTFDYDGTQFNIYTSGAYTFKQGEGASLTPSFEAMYYSLAGRKEKADVTGYGIGGGLRTQTSQPGESGKTVDHLTLDLGLRHSAEEEKSTTSFGARVLWNALPGTLKPFASYMLSSQEDPLTIGSGIAPDGGTGPDEVTINAGAVGALSLDKGSTCHEVTLGTESPSLFGSPLLARLAYSYLLCAAGGQESIFNVFKLELVYDN